MSRWKNEYPDDWQTIATRVKDAAGYYAFHAGLPDDREFVEVNLEMLLRPDLFDLTLELSHV